MASVALVCMPWHVVRSPSIQLGILGAVLEARGVRWTSHSLHLQFADFVRRCPPDGGELLSLEDYFALGDRWFLTGAGDYAFAVPPVRAADGRADRRLLQRLRQQRVPGRLVRRLPRLRERVPRFLTAAADEILAGDPAVVGFTTTFGQTVPALALAFELERRRPGLCIVFGGAACEGEMGAALHRTYPCVDVVVRGEGERVFPAVVEAVLAGAAVPALPGLCLRDGGRSVAVPEQHGAFVALDDVPPPDYREYFDRLAALDLESRVEPVLPVETARGCWWGAKSHCTFCGLNGQTLTYRAKSPTRVVDELVDLAQRHRVLDFTAADNIIDQGYFETVLPELAARGLDLRVFWQTKANLTRAQVRLLRRAGVHWIRPGIESLSTPALRRMQKGVAALQNIRLLKWCAEQGVHVAWNIIHGMPGETADELAAMARLVPQLVHLSAPALVPLTLDRFSPLHAAPAAHGLRVLGAPPHHRDLLGLDDTTLQQLAWTFDHGWEPGRAPPQGDELAALRQAVEHWRANLDRNRGALTWRRGPAFVVVDDARTTWGRRRFELEGLEAATFLACDGGATPAAIAATAARQTAADVSIDAVRAVLRELVAEGLVHADGDCYLGLATAAEPREAAAVPAAGARRRRARSGALP